MPGGKQEDKIKVSGRFLSSSGINADGRMGSSFSLSLHTRTLSFSTIPTNACAALPHGQVTSQADLHAHFAQLRTALAEPETEHSWERLDRALAKLEAITKGGAYKFDEYVELMRDRAISVPLCNSVSGSAQLRSTSHVHH